jgi:dienelactone hydrolase
MSPYVSGWQSQPLLFDGDVAIGAGHVRLGATLALPQDAIGLILFAHGSGSSRYSPRNRAVAMELNNAGFATLLLDLLTPEEERVDQQTGSLRFDVQMLGDRLADATDWAARDEALAQLHIGYFGASTGAAAALIAAASRPQLMHAIISRGGRPDLAGASTLRLVRCPTLLIVGELDVEVYHLNMEAYAHMQCEKRMAIVPGATHLFEEAGAMQQVSSLARKWFAKHLAQSARSYNV